MGRNSFNEWNMHDEQNDPLKRGDVVGVRRGFSRAPFGERS